MSEVKSAHNFNIEQARARGFESSNLDATAFSLNIAQYLPPNEVLIILQSNSLRELGLSEVRTKSLEAGDNFIKQARKIYSEGSISNKAKCFAETF